MRIVRRETYRRMPWKNGQGLTEEVTAFPDGPEGVVGDGFDWRLSIAHVDADGPFSRFPGIDRTIALLEGEGLALDLPAGGTVRLAPGGEPFSFPGEWAIASRNLGGPTVDLNIMTRRGRVDHVMRRLALDGRRRIHSESTMLIVVCGECAVTGSAGTQALSRFDTVLLDAGDAVEIETAAPGFAFEISLSASE